jgi:hypothetical protein
MFYDGQKKGQGTYTWQDGKIYTGMFENGHPNGQGTQTFPSSSQKYSGEYYCGLKNGHGTEYKNDGTFYKGEWVLD